MSHPPPAHPWPLKLVTLLFSGGLAVVAVGRAGLAGCDVAGPPPDRPTSTRPTIPDLSPRPLDFWGDNDSAVPLWTEQWMTPAAPKPDAWFHLYTLDRRLIDRPEEPEELPYRYFGGAKADPDAWARELPPALEETAKKLPENYFGGAKSDADVWGGLTGTEIGEAYGVGGLGKLDTSRPGRKRGRR